MPATLKTLNALIESAKAQESPALAEWKKQGGKIVGVFYDYVPGELFTAAGVAPFRMRAVESAGTELAEAYFTDINCSYVRHCFNQALSKKLEFLDGVVVHNFCDHMRRVYDNWKVAFPESFVHFMVLPKKRGEEQAAAYRAELASLRAALENRFKTTITDEKLRQAICLHNEARGLLREINALRKRETPSITGAEMLSVVLAGLSTPMPQYVSLLKSLLAELTSAAPRFAKPKARLLLLAGGAMDDPRQLEILESQGGMIVADASSLGGKLFWRDVSETGDPLTALARYEILERPACVRFCLSQEERDAFLAARIDEYKVDGVISVATKFCDLWEFEQVMASRFLAERKTPHLELQNEYVLSGAGQIKTRVQAFVETLR